MPCFFFSSLKNGFLSPYFLRYSMKYHASQIHFSFRSSDRQKGLSIGFRNNFFDASLEFLGNNFCLLFQPAFFHRSFFFYFNRSCRVARLRRAQRAQGCSGNVARAPTFSLESFIHRPKRRKQEKGRGIACMSASLPKRDSCSLRQVTATGAEQLRYGRDLVRPLFIWLISSIFLVRSPPPVFSFCGNHSLNFLMAVR